MTTITRIAGTAILLGLAGTVQAAPIVLDFEGVGNDAKIQNFYNGGTDSQGNSGVDYGVGFSDNALGIVDADAGGDGNFANEPSPDTIAFFLQGGAATMNVAAGFNNGFSFYYAAINNPGSVNVYDGLDGTGHLLASLDLGLTSRNCKGDPTGQFCDFEPVGVSFKGIARSVDFGGVANQVGFDDITIGSATAGGSPKDVPEPTNVALFGFALCLLGAAIRRRRQDRGE